MTLLDKIGPNGDLFSSCIGEVAPASSEILRHALERWSQCLVRGGGWGEEAGQSNCINMQYSHTGIEFNWRDNLTCVIGRGRGEGILIDCVSDHTYMCEQVGLLDFHLVFS